MQYWHYSARSGWVVRDRCASSGVCPLCRGILYRIPLRVIDRLRGLLSRLERLRYQCESQACGWQGNLLTESALS